MIKEFEFWKDEEWSPVAMDFTQRPSQCVTLNGRSSAKIDVTAHSLRKGTSWEDAEDLVQEAVLRLHAYTHAGKTVLDEESFVQRTALNLAIDAHRPTSGIRLRLRNSN